MTPADAILSRLSQGGLNRTGLFELLVREYPDMAEHQRISVLNETLRTFLRAGKITQSLGIYFATDTAARKYATTEKVVNPGNKEAGRGQRSTESQA